MPTLHNRTRVSRSIPERLTRERRYGLLPVYYALLLSDLWREGVENSGSFRFADHVYRGKPSGRYGVGCLLDAALLALPSVRSMRNRYLNATREIVKHAKALAGERDEIHVLSLPCGIARDLRDAASRLRREAPEVFAKARFHGVDLDPAPLELSRAFVAEEGLGETFSWRQGDALTPAEIPAGMDIVTSHGLCEFMPDELCATFYKNVYASLREGGLFITSGMRPHAPTRWLLENLAELRARYRDREDLEALVRQTEFRRAYFYRDEVGHLTTVLAYK